MHRRTNSKSNYVVSTHSRKLHIAILPILGIATSLGLSALLPPPSTYASVELSLPQSQSAPYSATLNPTSTDSSFASIVVPIGVSGSDVEGISVQVTSTSEETSLVGEGDNRIPTLSSSISSSDFEDTNSNTYNNRWGYRLAGINSNSVVATNTASIVNNDVVVNKDSTNPITWGTFKNTTLASENFSPILPASQISNSKTYKLVADEITFNNIYDGNFSGLLAIELATKVDSTISKGAYLGEVLVSITADPYEVSQIFGIKYMQQMTSSICNRAATPDNSIVGDDKRDTNLNSDKLAVYNGNGTWIVTDNPTYSSSNNTSNYVQESILYDRRDSKPYLIRKLADGNCWMSSNLAFDFISGDGVYSDDTSIKLAANAMTLTSSDTNTPDNWTPDANTYKTQSINETSGGWGADDTQELHSFSWLAYDNGATAFGGPAESQGENSGKLYEFRGNLYNWNAATLGTGFNTTTNNTDAPASVCPKGWRLPPNASSTFEVSAQQKKSYGNLLDGTIYEKTVDSVTSFPLDFPRLGLYYNGKGLAFQDQNGNYWSSTASGIADRAYNFFFSPAGVNVVNNTSRTSGRAVRCVAE